MTIHTLIALVAILATVLVCAWLTLKRTRNNLLPLANIGEGTHAGKITKKSDVVIATRYLLAKIGTDISHIDLADAADIPLGVITDEAEEIEDLVNVNLLGSTCDTQLVVASAAVVAGVFVVPADDGKVRTLPAAAGTYYIIGRALQAAGADGDVIEIDPCLPVQRVVA